MNLDKSPCGPLPRCKSLADVDNVLAELCVLDRLESTVETETKAKLDEVKKSATQQLSVEIGEIVMTVAKRRKQLEDAARKYCESHLVKELPADRKSIQLTHGTVGFREAPLAVKCVTTEKDVVAAIIKRGKLQALVDGVLSAIVGAFAASTFVRIKVELNKDGILSAWRSAPQRRASIEAVGVNVTGGSDEVYLEPGQELSVAPAA